MQQPVSDYPYHRLTRSWAGYRWWKPLLTGLLGVVFYLFFMLFVLLAGIIVAFTRPEGPAPYADRLEALDLNDPLVFAFTLISLVLMIPALALAALITGPRPIGLFSSVRGSLRWGWLGRCFAVAALIYALSFGLSFLLAPLPGQPGTTPEFSQSRFALMAALTIFLVPFQAAAEEYVFRGYLMQTIGSWLRHPAFAILLPVPLFVLGHGYDPLGQTDVALFAIFAGWITWRTGGLEAAIAAHTINNSFIFLLGALGLVDINAKEGSPAALIVSVLTLGIFAAVVVRMSARLERTRPALPPPWTPAPTYLEPGGPRY